MADSVIPVVLVLFLRTYLEISLAQAEPAAKEFIEGLT